VLHLIFVITVSADYLPMMCW